MWYKAHFGYENPTRKHIRQVIFISLTSLKHGKIHVVEEKELPSLPHVWGGLVAASTLSLRVRWGVKSLYDKAKEKYNFLLILDM